MTTYRPLSSAFSQGVCWWCGRKLRHTPRKEDNGHISVPSCGCAERKYRERVEEARDE